MESFAKKLVEAISYLALAGAGWKVALFILELLGV